MNRKQYVHENVVHNFMKDEDGNVTNTVQNYMDFVNAGLDFAGPPGMVIGNVLDAGSALVDVAQGEFGDAGMRAIQAVPGLGSLGLATKLGAKGVGKVVSKGLTSTPSKLTATTTPIGIGAVSAVKDSLSGEKEGEEGEEGVDDELKSSEKTAAQAASDSQELVRNFAASQIFGKKKIIPHGTVQTFESVSSDITRCIMESTIKDKIVTPFVQFFTRKPQPVRSGTMEVTPRATTQGTSGRGRRGGDDAQDTSRRNRRGGDDDVDTKDKQPGYLSRFLVPGLGASAVLASAFGLPMAVGKLYGSDTSAPAGQGPGAGSQGDGDVPAQGGVSTVLDRLSAVSGFIPGFNPAGAALGALGRRVGT